MKTYILQKDLPDVKAGAKFKMADLTNFYVTERNYPTRSFMDDPSYHMSLVENNPEWFVEELVFFEEHIIRAFDHAWAAATVYQSGGRPQYENGKQYLEYITNLTPLVEKRNLATIF